MYTPCNSRERMSENQFSNINYYPKRNPQNKERRNSLKRTQTLARNSSELDTMQSRSKSENNPRKERKSDRRRRRQIIAAASTSNPGTKQKSVPAKIRQWCAQCCRKKKSKLTEARKKKANFCKRLKRKCRRRKKKKKTTFSRESSVSTVQQEDGTRETSSKERGKRKKVDKIRVSKRSKERKRKKEGDLTDSSVHTIEADERSEEVVRGPVSDLGVDFTKSCCYLCAKNTMAITAAMSKAEKFHVSIQASFKEKLTSDKSCSPTMQVRTVQSSVRVKRRDMGTSHPEREKSKKGKPKLKLKKFNILTKLKLPTYPKVRTVACETDKSMRRNNVPQCRARQGAQCVTEATRTK
ncbi:unnamed protein product [Xylocopa violacea]|uniref:Uncharacterized protein n=1 Tax=Xylocopa violacea TaxID=135666 RepID=A0ABP1N8Z2_XYLVO